MTTPIHLQKRLLLQKLDKETCRLTWTTVRKVDLFAWQMGLGNWLSTLAVIPFVCVYTRGVVVTAMLIVQAFIDVFCTWRKASRREWDKCKVIRFYIIRRSRTRERRRFPKSKVLAVQRGKALPRCPKSKLSKLGPTSTLSKVRRFQKKKSKFGRNVTQSDVPVRGLGLIWTSVLTRSDRDLHQRCSRTRHRNLTRLVSHFLLTSLIKHKAEGNRKEKKWLIGPSSTFFVPDGTHQKQSEGKREEVRF